MKFHDDVDDPGDLDLPCPTCGEYGLRAEAHLRDVALDVAFPAAGEVTLDFGHFGAQVITLACQVCGDELDPEDAETGDLVERFLDSRLQITTSGTGEPLPGSSPGVPPTR